MIAIRLLRITAAVEVLKPLLSACDFGRVPGVGDLVAACDRIVADLGYAVDEFDVEA